MPRLDPPGLITEDEVRAALQPPRHFGYLGDNAEMFVTWSLGPIVRHRDSDLLQQSNADALIRHLESDPSLDAEWEITGANHFAVGWVDHLSFRVVDEHGAPTRMFRVVKDWFRRLEGYPVADEEDFARREYEETLDNIEVAGFRYANEVVAPPDWPTKCFGWLWEHEPDELEPRDGGGGWPSDEAIIRCLKANGWLEPEYDDEIEE